jgi:2-polyprenyl-3-methyl-5-hydroxy-6-metoxy-1,4-benzoquinol methylase
MRVDKKHKFLKYNHWGEYHWAEWMKPDSGYRKHVIRLINWVKEHNVLDIGCGDGLTTFMLACKGIDTSEVGIHYAQKRRLKCEVGSIYELEHLGHFDAVLLSDTIEWLDDAEAGMAEVAKITDKVYIATHLADPNGTARLWNEQELNIWMMSIGWVVEGSEVALGRVYGVYTKCYIQP